MFLVIFLISLLGKWVQSTPNYSWWKPIRFNFNVILEANIVRQSKCYNIDENLWFYLNIILKVHMNRKFFLCRYKLSPLKYTISKFETFGVKIGDVTGVQSYAFCPEKWSSNRAGKRPKCHVMWRNFGCTISSISSMAVLFHIFQPSPGSLKTSFNLRSGKNSLNVTEGKQTFATKITSQLDPSPSNFVTIF